MICAVSPSHVVDESEVADLFGPDDGFGDEDGQPLPAVASRDVVDGGDLRIDDDDNAAVDEPVIAQAPVGIPSPAQPTAIEIALHWLTHLPYRSWCRWCVSAKRRNAPHYSLPRHSREIPLFVADYCFVRDSRDDDLLTCFVGRLYPSRALIAIPCDVKGPDDYAVGRLVSFLRDCGVKRLVYMSDQEKAIGSMITAAMDVLSGDANWVGAVRENSAVGESQSNGKAEAAVQAIEDQLRVMKAALESRISARIPSQHPIMKWLVEYASVVLNKYAVQPSGHTAYHDLHGKRVSEKLVEFGEVVLHYVPKKRRQKLDMRWALGVFLGTTMATNESYIGLSNGSVVRGRAINRVRPDKRWSVDFVQNIKGSPSNPMCADDTVVESFPDPHANAGDDERDALEDDVVIRVSASRRVKINKRDIDKYGASPNCPKCRAYTAQNEKAYDHRGHTEACRLRFYKLMEEDLGKSIVAERSKPIDPEPEPADVIDPPFVDPNFNEELADLIENDAEIAEAACGPADMDPSFANIDEAVIDSHMSDDEPNADDHPMAAQYGMDVDMLLSMGVEPIDAIRYVRKCMHHTAAITFHEAYGRGGLSDEARRSPLNVKGLRSLDFACQKDDGSHWDFSKQSDRQEALRLIESDDPDWVIGSPPCTAFSLLNVGLNYPKMDKEEVRKRIKEGLVHLKFVCQLYRRQIRNGKFFLHEHPNSALSWKTKPILRMLKLEGVSTVVNDQCMFGLIAKGPDGTSLPAKKPTRWMSNSSFMLDRTRKRILPGGPGQETILLGGPDRETNTTF